jgi:hypothetical protein
VSDATGGTTKPPPGPGGGFRDWLRRRPWVWVVLLFVAVVVANLAMVVIALMHPAVPVR